MSRYIDEKDVYKLVEPSGLASVHCSQIDDLPRADVVEVVRCKDCEHYKGEQSNCWLMRVKMLPNDFCSYGKRREE